MTRATPSVRCMPPRLTASMRSEKPAAVGCLPLVAQGIAPQPRGAMRWKNLLRATSRGQRGDADVGGCVALFVLAVIVYEAVVYWPIALPSAVVLTALITYLVRQDRRRKREKALAQAIATAERDERVRAEKARIAAEKARIASRLPGPRPVVSWRAAEFYARDVLAGLGFEGVSVTNATRDGGVDVRGQGVVAQVKFEANKTPPHPVQALVGVASVRQQAAVFFSFAGYSQAAARFAENARVALFRFDQAGGLWPLSTEARRLVERLAKEAPQPDVSPDETAPGLPVKPEASTVETLPPRGYNNDGTAPVTRSIPRIPVSVTPDVVRAVLVKLGSATSAQIAEEITAAGAPVSSDAVRILAKRAGIGSFVDRNGQLRYRFVQRSLDDVLYNERRCYLCDHFGPPGTCPVHDQS